MIAEELMQFLMITKMNLFKMLSEVPEMLLKLHNSRTSFEDTKLDSGKILKGSNNKVSMLRFLCKERKKAAY